MNITEAVKAALKDFGLTNAAGLISLVLAMQPQAEIYSVISVHPMAQLREAVGFSSPKMTRITKRLASCGVIEVITNHMVLPGGTPVYRKSVKFTREFIEKFFEHLES
ncbi:hypothetical protein LAE43_005031 [Escherichia coli]|nr:hypothetical protein [Escherichia coli]